MKTLLVVYHSMTGGAEQMAHALIEGTASEAGTGTRLLHASAAKANDVINADGYVFATPENLAAISGLMKDFFDRFLRRRTRGRLTTEAPVFLEKLKGVKELVAKGRREQLEATFLTVLEARFARVPRTLRTAIARATVLQLEAAVAAAVIPKMSV